MNNALAFARACLLLTAGFGSTYRPCPPLPECPPPLPECPPPPPECPPPPLLACPPPPPTFPPTAANVSTTAASVSTTANVSTTAASVSAPARISTARVSASGAWTSTTAGMAAGLNVVTRARRAIRYGRSPTHPGMGGWNACGPAVARSTVSCIGTPTWSGRFAWDNHEYACLRGCNRLHGDCIRLRREGKPRALRSREAGLPDGPSRG